MKQDLQPGLIVLLGSGETQPSSSKSHEFVLERLPDHPQISVLETPAGFELNSAQVAGRIEAFLARRLQNYDPVIHVIPARKRGTAFSPDRYDIVESLFDADEILLGPGSPSYCTKQLKHSLTYDILRSRQRLGAAIFLSSAATISFGAYSIPVYEIYKVGDDPYWKRGLNFFGDFGMNLAVVPHWNNHDGGDELDTSHCYIGLERFRVLQDILPDGVTILGIDDHTSLIIDLLAGCGRVCGYGRVTIINGDNEKIFGYGDVIPLSLLGDIKIPWKEGIPEGIWQEAVQRQERKNERSEVDVGPPEMVMALVGQREAAREQQAWDRADNLRDRIEGLGWQVTDTPEGPRVSRKDPLADR